MSDLINLSGLSIVPVYRELMDTNAFLSEHGLALTAEDAKDISETREKAIRECDRIEVGTGPVCDIVKKFAQSRYVSKENFAEVINEVTYVFYYIKTETDDRISDGALIDELFSRFELWCLGSVDSLLNREAEKIIRKVNAGENYQKWYSDRDGLDTEDSDEASGEAPASISLDEYGLELFAGEETDRDQYVPDVSDDVPDETGLDLYDELTSQDEDETKPSGGNTDKKEEDQ